MKYCIITSAALGIVFGVVSNFPPLLGSWINLIIWAAVGILAGLFIVQKKYIVPSGLSYGFFLSVAFLVSGFKGSSDHIIGFTVLLLVLSMVGAGCGFVLVWIGNKLKFLGTPY